MENTITELSGKTGLCKPICILPLAIFILCATTLVAVSFHFDSEFLGWQNSLPKDVKKFAEAASDVGDWPGLMLIGAAFIVISHARKSRSLRRVVVCMMLSATLAGIVANVLKNTTGRTRPNAKYVERGWHGPVYQGEATIGKSKFNSFPSGHSASAAGFFGFLLFLRMPSALLGFATILLVPAARLGAGAHYLSDIAMAIFLGLLSAFYVRHRGYERFLVAFQGIRVLLVSLRGRGPGRVGP